MTVPVITINPIEPLARRLNFFPFSQVVSVVVLGFWLLLDCTKACNHAGTDAGECPRTTDKGAVWQILQLPCRVQIYSANLGNQLHPCAILRYVADFADSFRV